MLTVLLYFAVVSIPPVSSSPIVMTTVSCSWRYEAVNLVKQLRTRGQHSGHIGIIYDGVRSEMVKLLVASGLADGVRVLVASEMLPEESQNPPCVCGTMPDQSYSSLENSLKRRSGWRSYYTKIAIFGSYFKQFSVVLYLDATMHVYRPIAPLFALVDSSLPPSLFANPDSW